MHTTDFLKRVEKYAIDSAMMSGSDSVRLPSSLRILWMANLWCLLLTHVWKKDVLRSPSKSHLVLVFCLQYVALYNSLCLSLALAACKFLGEPGHRIRQKSSSALVSLFVGPHLLEDVAESEETPASKGLPSSSQPEPKLGKAILVRHRLLCLTYHRLEVLRPCPKIKEMEGLASFDNLGANREEKRGVIRFRPVEMDI